jgi:hypothetical protein
VIDNLPNRARQQAVTSSEEANTPPAHMSTKQCCGITLLLKG